MRWWVAAVMTIGAADASAQNYPNKPVRMVTAGIGAAADVAARLVTPALSEAFKQPFIVDNRGIGVIPGEIVSKAPPDGYTLLAHASLFWIGPLIQPPPYDVLRDFAPITLLSDTPNLIVVNPSLPAHTVKELIAYAQAKPGVLNYASGGNGAPNHLAAELFGHLAGVKLVRIIYKSGTLQMTDLMAGHVQLMFPNAGMVAPFIKAGKLRGLAVASARPSPLAPGLPTAAAEGLPGFETSTQVGLFVPAKTPASTVKLLGQETARVLGLPEVRQRHLAAGTEAVGNSPQEFAALIRAEMAKWAKVIKLAGIKAE
jgi:tripartite-type tricarboxylate transporter receptor subunit TctC